jgi:hypothetical protein
VGVNREKSEVHTPALPYCYYSDRTLPKIVCGALNFTVSVWLFAKTGVSDPLSPDPSICLCTCDEPRFST